MSNNNSKGKNQYKDTARKKYGNALSPTDTNISIYLLLPLIIIIAIVPLIVRSHVYKPGLMSYPWFSNTEYFIDFFLYYKQWIFVIISIIMLFVIVFKGIMNKQILKKSTLLIPLGIYALLALLSTIFSEYVSFGFSGIFEQFESILAVLGYTLIVYYTYIFVNNENDVKFIFKFFFISILFLSLLGVAQALGYDIFRSDLGKKLILSKKYWNQAGEMDFNLGANRVYLTLFNPNYVGVYASLVIPIITSFLLFTKNKKKIAYYFVLILGMFISLLGSQSRAGFIGLVVSLLFIFYLFRKQILKQWKLLLTILILFIISFFLLNKLNNNYLLNKFSSIFKTNQIETHLKSIETTDEKVSIVYNDYTLDIRMLTTDGQFSGFSLVDENGQLVNYFQLENSMIFNVNDIRYPGFQLEPTIYGNYLSFRVSINKVDWYFTNQTGDSSYYYINNNGKLDKIIAAESALFTGNESLASGRGFIWSRTIPLLKNYLLLGEGANSFVFAYPQQDYVNLYNYGYSQDLINKPHNMFLQIAVQSGILSLIAFITFYVMYFISSLKLYTKSNFNSYLSQVGVAIFIGTISYMICGLTNDSTITVAPVFWTLIGLGIAINRMVKLKVTE